jgi:hypothetical protein
MRGFFPVVRMSRRFIEAYKSEVPGGWAGHFEALYPTIAGMRGLGIEDIGGTGPFTPVARRGRFYSNGHPDGNLFPGTFRFRPPVASGYFMPFAPEFYEEDRLWHPIKTSAVQSRGDPRGI